MSLWPRLASLPLRIDGAEPEALRAPAAGTERVTTLVHLHGGGETGLGEEVGGPDEEPHVAFRALVPTLELAGEWTLASFCAHVHALPLWSEPPEWELAHHFRTYAFESAALDLALRQAGRSLPDALGLTSRPLTFVNSLGLGDPPDAETIRARARAYPALRYKLDAVAAWSPELIEELAATGTVDTVDFKGRYGLPVEDEDALLTLYDRILEAFPTATLEDPHDLPAVTERMRPHAARVSYDAPIVSSASIAAQPLGVRTINVKPTRIGSLETLFALYAHCAAEGIAMYGGGMGELGVARGQIELLASLFHPDTANDVAPSAYNAPTLAEGLAGSPLPPAPAPVGFRRAEHS